MELYCSHCDYTDFRELATDHCQGDDLTLCCRRCGMPYLPDHFQLVSLRVDDRRPLAEAQRLMSELMEHPVYKEQSLLTLWDGHLVRVLGEVHRLLMLAQDKADRTD